ncbi:MAG: ketoacyl-ACP synthase III [bacterium]|nr:ketoacyl-ACP synthase III [bacterium]
MWNAGIAGIGSYAPERVLTNSDLEKMVDTSDEWIRTRTGISERHICDADMATSDMAVKAAAAALEDAGVEAADVDMIIVATVTPDMPFPATACIVQDRLGAGKAAAFDLQAGCSGFIYALTVGSQYIISGAYRNVLVIGADALTKVTDWEDRGTCVLFGDGAGAALLHRVPSGSGLLSFKLGAVGSGADYLKIPAGGSRLPASADTVAERGHFIKMEGNEVYKFAVRIMGEAALMSVEEAGLTTEDIDCLIPHQANIRIIDAAARRLGLPPEKVFINVQRYGNTSAASIPLALKEAVDSGKVGPGSVVVMVGFGAGLTWGAVTLRWKE